MSPEIVLDYRVYYTYDTIADIEPHIAIEEIDLWCIRRRRLAVYEECL